jgi:hypothetical protein
MPENNKPFSYLVPMSERSSLAVSSAMEDSNINKMKSTNSAIYQNLLNSRDKAASVIDKIAFGGMSLWFLLLAVLICVVLFSWIGKSQ